MKKLISGIFILVILFTSCNNASKIADELNFLWEIRKDFGGEWIQSYEDNCYKIKITNSDRINENSDSIDYYGVLIGRKYIESVDIKYPCLKLEIAEEKNYIVYSHSNSYEVLFDLNLIKNFKDLPIEDYLITSDAIYAKNMIDDRNIEAANKWMNSLKPGENKNPYVMLSKAYLLRENGDSLRAEKQIKDLLESEQTDDMIFHLIGGYYEKQNDINKILKYFKLAHLANPDNLIHLRNLSVIYGRMEKYDSSAIYATKYIKLKPDDPQAYFERAKCFFQMDSIEKGCKDIEKLYELVPEAQLDDSILNKCKFKKQPTQK